MVDYKLRLGDGTTFSVDEKGLTTWLQGGLVDDKARVQPTGSKKWFTLKQVLAAQGAQRGHADRQTEKGRADVDRQAAAETAEIERKVAEQRAAEERKAAEDLAAAERKAVEKRNAAERKLIEDREAAVRHAAEEAAAAEGRVAAERQAEQERLEAEKRATEERAAAERVEAEAREAARVAEAEKGVAAERAERAERKRKAEEARLEAEHRAAEEARLEAERTAAEQRAAERKVAGDRAAAERREIEAREAAAREAERLAEAEKLVAVERAERAERKRRADEERLAEQRAEERRASERRVAEEQAVRERAAAMDASSVPAPPDPPLTGIAIEPAATMVEVGDFERELGLFPVTFDDGVGPASSNVPAAHDRATLSPATRSIAPPGSEEAPSAAAAKAPTAVVKGLVRLLEVLDGGVTWVARIFAPRATPVELAPSRDMPAAAPAIAPAAPSAPSSTPAPSVIAAPSVAPPPWAAPPPAPWAAPAPKAAPLPTTPALRDQPRKPAMPPPSFQKLDVIPFAAAPVAPKVADDMWDGADVWEEPTAISSAFGVLWLWVKRVTIATALIVTVALLALNREKWVPQAQDAATVLGQGVDKLSERASSRTVPPQAIEAARAQIPYLRPQTIELIMAKSTGALEPAEVFRRAHQAAERARPSLPTHVAAEIDNLDAAVAAELDNAEGERLRAYLAAIRAGTPTAVYQDREAVWLMARGVRRLSAERLSRMEELFAQAVAAAHQSPAP